MKLSEIIAWALALSGWAVAIDYATGAGGMYTHPYDECRSMYETPEDISECVWIKENP